MLLLVTDEHSLFGAGVRFFYFLLGLESASYGGNKRLDTHVLLV
jgi:hypothetical protein